MRDATGVRAPWVVVCLAVLLALALLSSADRAEAAETTASPPPSVPVTATPAPPAEPTATPSPRTIVVGRSSKGRAIKLVRFGSGPRRILIVGGIHGNEAGAPVARAFVAYLRAHPSLVPTGTQLDVLACANPDGEAKGTRGNANRVDVNRNFPSRDWRRLRFGRLLTSGRRAGSQPETKTLVRLLKRRYARVVSLHSKGGLTDGEGRGGVTLARRMAKAAGIKRVDMSRFGSYPGSLGSYVPEKYPAAYVVWELSSRKLTARVRAGLLVAVR